MFSKNHFIQNLIIGCSFSLMSFTTSAANNIAVEKNQSPIRQQTSQSLHMKKVEFQNGNIRMVGNLYYPKDYSPKHKYPAIVVTHPWGGVKEQTSGLYAKKLAEQGFITLAFDASHYGESGGEPRFVENPFERVDDIRSAIDYLTALPEVNLDQIGALGICAGGGYTISEAQTDHRVKAVAGISVFDIGAFSREGLGNILTISNEQRQKNLDEVDLQRSKEARGELPRIDKLIAPSKPSQDTPNFFRESYDYYATPRGQHPNSTGNFRYTSTSNQMAFYPFDHINSISPRPLLLIAGEKAESRYYSQRAYDQASQPKEIVIVPDAYHFDLYDKPQYVNPSVDKLALFFKSYLIKSTNQK